MIIKKVKKTGRRSKAFLSPEKLKIKISVFSAAARMAGASIGASYTHGIPIIEVDDYGPLTIPSRPLPGQDGTSGS